MPEILVSAIVLTLIAGATLTALISTNKAGAQERFRSQAQAIAQEDQARVRSMQISVLANSFSQTRNVINGPSQYTVTSTAQYVTESSGTTSCTENTASTEYIKVSSSVTWPTIGSRPAVALESIIAPPAGSTAPTRGALQVSVQNAAGAPRPNVPISGTGPASFSGTTSANGCAIFGNLPIGTYSVTPTLSNAVDPNGIAPAAQAVDVIGQSTKTLALQYDTPARINVSFTVRPYGTSNTAVSSRGDTVMVFNTGMSAGKSFGSVGSLVTTLSASSLFPFTSPDAVYAGSCQNIVSPTTGAGVASVSLTPGGTSTATVRLFPIYVTAHVGNSTSTARLAGATVYIKDDYCLSERANTTNVNGQFDFPGLPASRYDICVVANGRYRLTSDRTNNSLNGTSISALMGNAPLLPTPAPTACLP